MSSLNIYPHAAVECRFTLSDSYDMKSMHIHDVFEIYMALCEDVKFFVDDRIYDLQKGDVMLFGKNDLHKVIVSPDHPYYRCVIIFSDTQLKKFFQEGELLLSCFQKTPEVSRQLKLSPEDQTRFLHLAEAIAAKDKENNRFSSLSQWLNLGQILLMLCSVPRNTPLTWNPQGTSELSQTIFSYIDTHFSEDLSLDTLSSACFLNKSYLCRRFKKETGFHIHDYIIYRRLSNAITCLKNGESVGSTSRLCGFSSDTLFIDIFRKHIGVTPYQYAKNSRNRN